MSRNKVLQIIVFGYNNYDLVSNLINPDCKLVNYPLNSEYDKIIPEWWLSITSEQFKSKIDVLKIFL